MIRSRKLAKLISGFFLISNSCAFAASSVLETLNIIPSAQSTDYVNNKKQFQLYSLLTEQQHSQTINLSYQINQNTVAGLQSLLAVDQDISKKFNEIANNPEELKKLEQASQAVQTALLNGQKIYFYGTGSTGRLSAAVESAFWRPFWEKVRQTPAWPKIKDHLPDIQHLVRGEITGGDRALISSLEGFEDLQLIGQLQLEDNKIQKGDVVFAVTEGGETSAVIGTILAAANLYHHQPTQNLYFVYNNPDSVLIPFERSRMVIENPSITKINLTTGPQAITGSTRMQATTTSLYVCGIILEDALYQVLKRYLSPDELEQLGFSETMTLKKQLLDFADIQKIIYDSADKIAPWTDLEASTYAQHHKTTYFAQRALLPVFIDVTERAPTFRLNPLDSIGSEKQSWIQIWSPANTSEEAWKMLLHRPFHGLDPALYLPQFTQNIDDPYLRQTALKSLARAGQEQQYLYDLAFSPYNTKNNAPVSNDLGVMILLSDEQPTERFIQWRKLFSKSKAREVIVSVSAKPIPALQINPFRKLQKNSVCVSIIIPKQDPFALSQSIGLKMLLNANSTAVMAKLDRVVGNTMTDVNPSNLKLIGRATYLIQLHVNAVLSNPEWIKLYGKTPSIDFATANAILFDAMDYVQKTGKATESPEVPLAILRTLESLKQQTNISWQQTENILAQENLSKYLSKYENFYLTTH